MIIDTTTIVAAVASAEVSGDIILAAGEELALILDHGGKVALEVRPFGAGAGIAMGEWHKRTLAWRIAGAATACLILSAEAVTELLERLQPVLERVAAGHSVEWDGSKDIGRLTQDAAAASERIDWLLHACQQDELQSGWICLDAADWMDAGSLGLRAGMTVEERAALVAELQEVAKNDRILLRGARDLATLIDRAVDELDAQAAVAAAEGEAE